MGLSYNANWGTIQLQNSDMGNNVFIPELAPPPPPPPLDYQLFIFHDNFSIHDTCIEPLFEPPPPPDVHPPLYDDQSLLFNPTNLPEIFPGQHYMLLDSSSSHFEQQYFCPKRQKTSYHDYLGGMFDATASNFLPIMNSSPGQLFLPELPLEMLIPPLLDYPLPEVYDCGSSSEHIVHQESSTTITSNGSTSCAAGNGKNLSPQSIAARVRRKKISEKTQELGKLIPGGHKMNTAEMFQAASKYIKFLQAQLGVLQSMPSSIQENEGELEFRGLVTSPLVQEKMYMAEKCLVPKKMIESSLSNDHQLQSKPQLFKEINQLIN